MMIAAIAAAGMTIVSCNGDNEDLVESGQPTGKAPVPHFLLTAAC